MKVATNDMNSKNIKQEMREANEQKGNTMINTFLNKINAIFK